MKYYKGFSLVEVLIFVSILSLFFIVALTVTTFNLKNMKIQEHKILAAHYAEEGMEWVKQKKENDWQVFTSHSGNYCLNSLNWTSGVCDSYALGFPAFLKRDLTIINSGNPIDKSTITLTVSWLEGDIEQKIVLKSVLNLWE